jgi:hypothetical protein
VTVYTSLKFLKLPHSSWVVLTGVGGRSFSPSSLPPLIFVFRSSFSFVFIFLIFIVGGLGHLGIQYAHALGYKVLAIDAGVIFFFFFFFFFFFCGFCVVFCFFFFVFGFGFLFFFFFFFFCSFCVVFVLFFLILFWFWFLLYCFSVFFPARFFMLFL